MREKLEPLLKWATPGQRGFTDAMRAGVGSNHPPASSQASSSYGASNSQATQSTQRSVGGGGYGATPKVSAAPQPTAAQKAKAAQAEAARQAKIAAERLAYRKATELANVIKSFETVDDDSRRSSLLDTLCSEEDILSIPTHDEPPSIASGELTTNLMKHQVRR